MDIWSGGQIQSCHWMQKDPPSLNYQYLLSSPTINILKRNLKRQKKKLHSKIKSLCVVREVPSWSMHICLSRLRMSCSFLPLLTNPPYRSVHLSIYLLSLHLPLVTGQRTRDQEMRERGEKTSNSKKKTKTWEKEQRNWVAILNGNSAHYATKAHTHTTLNTTINRSSQTSKYHSTTSNHGLQCLGLRYFSIVYFYLQAFRLDIWPQTGHDRALWGTTQGSYMDLGCSITPTYSMSNGLSVHQL